jgi:hypothetical protein
MKKVLGVLGYPRKDEAVLGYLYRNVVPIPFLCKTATHSSLSLKDLYGQLSFTVEDGCPFQYISMQISSISIEMVLHVQQKAVVVHTYADSFTQLIHIWKLIARYSRYILASSLLHRLPWPAMRRLQAGTDIGQEEARFTAAVIDFRQFPRTIWPRNKPLPRRLSWPTGGAFCPFTVCAMRHAFCELGVG